MMSGRISLSAKLSVTILVVLAVSIATCFFVVYRNVAAVTSDAALREVEESNRFAATHIEGHIANSLQLARELATHAAALAQSGVTDRAAHGAVARATLEANDSILGSWYGWEPNALDGRDAEFVGTPGHDATGRYVPYYYRGEDGVALDVLLDYTVPGAGDYYILPLQRGAETLLEPYIYPVEGVPTLMTSLAVPIRVNGNLQGVAGVDVALKPLSQELEEIRPLGTGVVGLVSAAGAWVAHPNADLVTKPVATEDPGLGALLKTLSASGTAEMTGTSTLLGEESFISVLRIEVGNTGDALYLVSAIPTQTVWQWATYSLTLLVVSALVLMVVASVGCWLVLRAWLSRPLGALISSVDRITDGQLDQTVPFGDRSDEIGAMSRALDVFRQNAAQLRSAELESEQEARRQSDVVASLAQGLNRLAEGDLTATIPGGFDPRYEKLRQDYNATVASLRASMTALESAGEQIGSGAGAIEQAVSDLSRRTEDQASTLQETSSAFNRITDSVRETAKNADEANGIAAQTQANVRRSGVVVTEAVSSMDAILDSSRRISQIIGVIDDIAFQTNLLALNAGVEAARAGEAGRGFAVVASEVRALAQRAAEAARQVKELITESSTHVAKGVERVGAAGESLGEIVDKVENVASLISGIAMGAKEQYANLAEVTHSVARMDTVTQQNAAMAEETSAAATTLVANGRELSNLISKFDTGARRENRPSPAVQESHVWSAPSAMAADVPGRAA